MPERQLFCLIRLKTVCLMPIFNGAGSTPHPPKAGSGARWQAGISSLKDSALPSP
jgi:hypothetical protein